MRRMSIARSVQLALLGLTVVLTAIAAIGVASLYAARQDYEDTLSDALQVQAGAGRLLAAGVVEEATLRLSDSAAAHARAADAYAQTLSATRGLAQGDELSLQMLTQAATAQSAIRASPGATGAALAGRRPLVRLTTRQDDRIGVARADARRRSRRALAAIVIAGGSALLVALGLVAGLVAALRRPLEDLVDASRSFASGNTDARVDEEDGPEELRLLAHSFNRMAGDVQSATRRVEAERRRLDVTVRSLGDGLIIVGADGVVSAANPRATQLMSELAPGTLVGPDAVAEPAPLAQALEGEVEIEHAGRTLAVTASHLEAGAGTVWTVRDVTERARLERMKTEFVATASHELRSPLTSIKGFIELLSNTQGLTDRQREFVDIALMSTNRLVDLVNDLLDVARVEAGGIEIHRRPTDLLELITETTMLLRPRLEEKRQNLEVDAPPQLPRVLVDPARIRQILTNLLTNAHLYTDAGGTLGVRVAQTGHALTIAVHDTGRGMTEDQLQHVFDRFYRGHDEGPGGTGLGLSIVRSLVDLHGGAIDVQSAVGQGTTFTISLPRVADLTAPVLPRESLDGRRVLVVDDEAEVGAVISATLQRFGVEPIVVASGQAALDELNSGMRFDAITLDILMPGMSGFAVLRALRAEARLRRIPVVIVSVFSGREALSGEWVVPKPIDAHELADALGAAVVAGRVRVLAIGRPEVRPRLDAALDELGIEHDWAHGPDDVAPLSATRFYEVAAIDAGMPEADLALGALELRGRRMRRSVVVFADDAGTETYLRLDADPVPIGDAGAMVLGLLDPG